MEPQNGIISCKKPPIHPPTGSDGNQKQARWRLVFWILNPWCFVLVWPHLICLSPPIMSVPTFYVSLHLLCLSPPIMSVPTYYACPHLLCLSPPIMSVPTYYVCPHLLFCVSLSPAIIFLLTSPFLNLECGTSSPACLLNWSEFG